MDGCAFGHRIVDLPPIRIVGRITPRDTRQLRLIEAPFNLEYLAILKAFNEPGFEGPRNLDLVQPQPASKGGFRAEFEGEKRYVGGPVILSLMLLPGGKTQRERRIFLWFEGESTLYRITLRGNRITGHQTEMPEGRAWVRRLAGKHKIIRLKNTGPGGDDPNKVLPGQGLREAEFEIELARSIKWKKAEAIHFGRVSRTSSLDTFEIEMK